MKCKYEVENIFPTSLSFEEIRKSICEKIVNLIIIEKNKIYTL